MAYRLWRDQLELCALYLGSGSFASTAIVCDIFSTKLIGDDNHVPPDLFVENGNDASYHSVTIDNNLSLYHFNPHFSELFYVDHVRIIFFFFTVRVNSFRLHLFIYFFSHNILIRISAMPLDLFGQKILNYCF